MQTLAVCLFITLVAIAIGGWWMTDQMWGYWSFTALSAITASLATLGLVLMLWNWRIVLHELRTT